MVKVILDKLILLFITNNVSGYILATSAVNNID